VPTTRIQEREWRAMLTSFERTIGPEFEREFAKALRKYAPKSEIAAALERGDFDTAAELLSDVGDAFKVPLSEAMARAIEQGADLTGAHLPAGVDPIAFASGPRVAEYMASRLGEAITVNANVETIRRWATVAADTGQGAEWLADRIRDAIGLSEPYDQAVYNRYLKLLEQDFSKQEASAIAARYADDLLRTRARTIARTEMGRAAGFARLEYWTQAAEAGAIPEDAQREWVTALDEIVGEDHQQMHGVKVGLTETWHTPNGNDVMIPEDDRPNCRCTTALAL